MQDPIVMAFRKRMKHHGYSEIKIYKLRPFNGRYLVTAVEPLSHVQVSARYDHYDMNNAFRF